MMTLKVLNKILVTALLSGASLGAMTAWSGQALAVVAGAAQSDVKAKAGLVLDLKAGQVLQIKLPKRRYGREARQAQKVFKDTVIPLLGRNGYDFLGQLKVDELIIGESKPSAVEFFAYDSQFRQERLEQETRWGDLLDYRREGWRRMDVYTTVLADDLNIHFDPEKSYTLAVAWANPGNPENYDRYLDGVETHFQAVGARFVHKFRKIDYTNQSRGDQIPPVQLTLVEWDREDGLSDLVSSQAYKGVSHLFQSGVSDFRLYRLASPSSP